MDLDEGALKLIDPENLTVLNTQPIHTIRVWGVGRDNGRFVVINTIFILLFYFNNILLFKQFNVVVFSQCFHYYTERGNVYIQLYNIHTLK